MENDSYLLEKTERDSDLLEKIERDHIDRGHCRVVCRPILFF